jgi:hypothetical protein
MGWIILFIFYGMVGVLTYDMSRMLRKPRTLEPARKPARRPSPSPMLQSYRRLLSARSAGYAR